MEQFNEAVAFAQSHEIPWPRDPTADLTRWGVHHDDPPPFNRLREWVQRMQDPCTVAPFYGWLTWLNRDDRLFADASRSSWFMFGAGGHMVWIDPDNEAVVVARWLDGAQSAGFVRRVAQALMFMPHSR